MEIAVKNAAGALETVLAYMQNRGINNAPPAGTKWQERVLYNEGPEDMAVTSRLFNADDWTIEVSQNIAPLSRTIFQVNVFNARLHSFWKGCVRADSGQVEAGSFGSLSEDESRQAEEEFKARSRIPPPKPGGYGH